SGPAGKHPFCRRVTRPYLSLRIQHTNAVAAACFPGFPKESAMIDKSQPLPPLPSVSRRQLFGLGAGAAAAFGLAACGTGSSSGSSAAGGASVSGGTLTMGIASTPDTLDPGATGLALTLLISMAMFDPLVWWLPDGKGGSEFVPGLAESYTVSPDASVYTF